MLATNGLPGNIVLVQRLLLRSDLLYSRTSLSSDPCFHALGGAREFSHLQLPYIWRKPASRVRLSVVIGFMQAMHANARVTRSAEIGVGARLARSALHSVHFLPDPSESPRSISHTALGRDWYF